MPSIARLAAAAVAVTLLAAPAAVIAPAGSAAPVRAPSVTKMSLKPDRTYSHHGQAGVKVTASFDGKATGRVRFTQNGDALGRVEVKKGRATVQLPQTNAPGVYRIRATWKGKVARTRVRVYDSSISLSAVAFTVSKADLTDATTVTGTVRFKGAAATRGYVDIYRNGNVDGGQNSPDFCCMDEVSTDGTFTFDGYDFLDRVADDNEPGTYSYRAFYTDGNDFADYIHSAPIVVTVTE